MTPIFLCHPFLWHPFFVASIFWDNYFLWHKFFVTLFMRTSSLCDTQFNCWKEKSKSSSLCDFEVLTRDWNYFVAKFSEKSFLQWEWVVNVWTFCELSRLITQRGALCFESVRWGGGKEGGGEGGALEQWEKGKLRVEGNRLGGMGPLDRPGLLGIAPFWGMGWKGSSTVEIIDAKNIKDISISIQKN